MKQLVAKPQYCTQLGAKTKLRKLREPLKGTLFKQNQGKVKKKLPKRRNVPPAPESTATGDSTASGEESRPLTPEEQAEIDAMVDFTVTEETLGELNANLPADKEPLKVGDVVKLAKDHPILTRGGGEGSV
jgi:hypothetical protein